MGFNCSTVKVKGTRARIGVSSLKKEASNLILYLHNLRTPLSGTQNGRSSIIDIRTDGSYHDPFLALCGYLITTCSLLARMNRLPSNPTFQEILLAVEMFRMNVSTVTSPNHQAHQHFRYVVDASWYDTV